MTDENDKLPSDQEDGGLKPRPAKKPDASDTPPPEKKVEQDPSEQPS